MKTLFTALFLLISVMGFSQATYMWQVRVSPDQSADTANVMVQYPTGNGNLSGRGHAISYSTLAGRLAAYLASHNFFNTNLTQTGSRSHEAAGYDTQISDQGDFLINTNVSGKAIVLTNSYGSNAAHLRVNSTYCELSSDNGAVNSDIKAGDQVTITNSDGLYNLGFGIYPPATDNSQMDVLALKSDGYLRLKTLGTLATQSGTFSGTSSGTNTGDNAVNSLYSGLAASKVNVSDTASMLTHFIERGDTATQTAHYVKRSADISASGILSNSGVTAASYTNANITVDAKGRVTAAANGSGGSPSLTSNYVGYGVSGLLSGTSGLQYNGSLLTATTNSLGVTQDDTKGLLLSNTTAATSGNQQISPSIHWSGRGWKTNATAASQSVDWRAYVLPVQGTTNPSSILKIQSSVNGGSWADKFGIGSNGEIYDSEGSLGTIGQVLTSQGTSPGVGSIWYDVTAPTPGIDDVLAVGQSQTGNRNIETAGNDFSILNSGEAKFLIGSGGDVINFGDPAQSGNGNEIKLINSENKAFLDNTAHNINVGINTSSPSAALDVVGDAKISGTINGVKKYVALLTQSGTDAPVANELENSLIATPNWTYDSEGNYSINCAACFTVNKTWCILQCKTTFPFEILYIDDSTITIFGDGAGDDYLSKAAFEIRVYP